MAGDPFSEILTAAWRCNAELVVMGTHRRHGLKEFFLGTTIERVTRKGERPVLVVKDEPAQPYRSVVIAVDFSVGSRRALQAALPIVPGGEFHLIHAYSTPFSSILTDPATHQRVAEDHKRELGELVEEELAAFARRHPDHSEKIHITMTEGEVTDVLAEACHRIQPDLVAVGTHARTGFAQQLMGGSVAELVLDNPPSDVLVVKGW